MALTIEEKLKKRKIDALRRGIHRVEDEEAGLPFDVNIVGIGKAGADIVAEALNALPSTGPKMSALVVDLGDQDLAHVRAAAAALSPERADVEIVALPRPRADELHETLEHYDDFLRLEYPLFPWKPCRDSWLPAAGEMPEPGPSARRAYAKAVYGRAYYDSGRPLAAALRRFGEQVEATRAQSIVCVVFGMGGGTGSGIVVDMARHLTNVILGRRALVVGVGILPCSGDKPESRGGALFAALNEFDCLGDEGKNSGIVTSCGELFRNPFTAGLLLVPQEHIWSATRDLAATQRRTSQEIGSLLTARGGANLWETLRMLNWVAAPSTQHSAARTPWGPKWIHMFAFADLGEGQLSLGAGLRSSLGILDTYIPEFIEFRVPSPDLAEASVASQIEAAFAPTVPPQIASGGREGSVQFVLPSISKHDLRIFFTARDDYERKTRDQRIFDHSLLLEQGILLSEPSTRIDGMAGASLNGGDGWVAVPLKELLGERPGLSAS